jgi:UMF1 family MFS transporter
LPVLVALRRMLSERPPAPYPVRAPSLRAVVGTLLRWREHREAFRLLLGFYLVNDALVTLVFFVTILFQNRYGLSVEGLLWLVLLYHVVALPATFWFSRLSDRWDKRRTLYALIAILCAAVLLLAFWNAPQAPLTVVVLLALVFGSLQAVCRALLMLLAPAARRSEFYGFNAVSGRLSAALGPISFGAVAAATGSQQAGLMLLVAFLLAGAAVLARLRLPAPE